MIILEIPHNTGFTVYDALNKSVQQVVASERVGRFGGGIMCKLSAAIALFAGARFAFVESVNAKL